MEEEGYVGETRKATDFCCIVPFSFFSLKKSNCLVSLEGRFIYISQMCFGFHTLHFLYILIFLRFKLFITFVCRSNIFVYIRRISIFLRVTLTILIAILIGFQSSPNVFVNL